MRQVLLAIAVAVMAGVWSAPAQAAEAAVRPDTEFYRGKSINWIVATGPGGGYDTYSRLIARYMPKHLSNARIVIRNVPGAGHIVGANTLYAARPDGLTIGMFNTGLIYNQLLQRPGVRFDLGRMSWIGSSAHDVRVIVISKRSGFASFKEMQDSGQPLKFAAAGVGSAAYNDTRISAMALGLNVQIVSGYEGQEGELSMLRGDVVGQVGAASAFEGFVNSGGGYYGLVISGTSRVLPGVPLARDYIRNERGRRLLGLIEALSELGRLVAGPPGIPPARLAALRQAHDRAVRDPALLAEARRINLPIDLTPGAEVAAKVREALTQPPEAIALLREATSVAE